MKHKRFFSCSLDASDNIHHDMQLNLPLGRGSSWLNLFDIFLQSLAWNVFYSSDYQSFPRGMQFTSRNSLHSEFGSSFSLSY